MLFNHQVSSDQPSLYADPVVSTTTQYLRRTIELLPQHQPHELVRECHRAQRESFIGTLHQLSVEPEVAADGEQNPDCRPLLEA